MRSENALLSFFVGIFGGTVLSSIVVHVASWEAVLLAWAYLCADNELLLYTRGLTALQHPNWLGKAVSILLGVAVIYLLRLPLKEIGIISMNAQCLRWIILGSAVAAGISMYVNYLLAQHNHNTVVAESVWYEAFLPGIAEELAYRGITYGLLLRAFANRSAVASATATIFTTSLTFGIAHVYPIVFVGGHIPWSMFAFAVVGGIWYAVLRQMTGSIIAPVVAHNVANLLGLWASTLG